MAPPSSSDASLEALWDSRQDSIPWSVRIFEGESRYAKVVCQCAFEELGICKRLLLAIRDRVKEVPKGGGAPKIANECDSVACATHLLPQIAAP